MSPWGEWKSTGIECWETVLYSLLTSARARQLDRLETSLVTCAEHSLLLAGRNLHLLEGVRDS